MVSSSPSATRRIRRKKSSRRPSSSQNFPITFGTKSTILILTFAIIYGTFIICLQPMLHEDNAKTLHDSLQHVKGRDKVIHAKERLMQRGKQLMHKLHRDQQQQHEHDHTTGNENDIVNKSWNEFQQKDHVKDIDTDNEEDREEEEHIKVDNNKETGGFMILGMHRSGTSMLAGLLVEGFGYKPGEPLIQPAFDNEKGFYELIPAVLQNDIFMQKQQIDWGANVKYYDAELAFKQYKRGLVEFVRGEKALRVLNDKANRPFLQKDPRMCITLRTWLPLLDTKPAVVFTYRHPLEVALSLFKRQGFKLTRGLRLWIHYNKAAVVNSADLCRVLSSNNVILADPLNETKRIANDLTTKCNVPLPPKMIDQKVVNDFVDSSLQHNKKLLKEKADTKRVLETHGDCVVKDFDSHEIPGSPEQEMEKEMYLKAMKLYCDFESGEAYRDDYVWPDV